MHVVPRRVGRMVQKSAGDNAKVGNLLGDYNDVDNILAKIADHTKTWRDAWAAMSLAQLGIACEYEGLWDPIASSEDSGRPLAPTPDAQMMRTHALREAFNELKTDLMEEVSLIDAKIIKPCVDARDCISPLKKKIKKRDNLRLDFENAQNRAGKLRSKMGRNAKEDKTLMKAEEDLNRITQEFQVADNHLKEILPPLITATFSIVPPIIETIVLTQNRLLGLCYTTLDTYCQDYGFMSPPPPLDAVIEDFHANYDPARKEIEGMTIVLNGRAIRTDPQPSDKSRNGLRSPPVTNRPNRLPPPTSPMTTPQPTPTPRIPSETRPSGTPMVGSGLPTDFTTASRIGTGLSQASPGPSPALRTRGSDYFNTRRPSTSSVATTATAASYGTMTSTATTATAASSIGTAVAAKKKPPPPPPKKPSVNRPPPAEFVVANYDFTGQSHGDLSFSEGDRIRIVQKTGTDQDWWVGELHGVKGNFPANYCQAA